MTARLCIGLAAALLFAAGCDRPAGKPESAEPAGSAVIEAGDRAIVGRVVFRGTPPVMGDLPDAFCHETSAAVPDETVIVGENGGLANVLVSIEGTPAQPIDAAARPPAVIDQTSCRFVPHVVGVMVGQSLTFRSSDPTLHNVHFKPRLNRADNFAFAQGDEHTVSFTTPEVIRVKCDVHAWMEAWVGVFAHPHFAVTDGQGAFEIAGLSPGTYTLKAWHERYGVIEQQVTIDPASNQPATAELIYEPPTGGRP